MPNYRFNWNPAAWSWTDLPERLRELAETGSTTIRWSTGRSKQPELGDRVLLLRVGVPPKGIVGVGTIVREPYEHRHWNQSRAAQGEQAMFVDIRFSRLAQEPLLTAEKLADILPADMKLFTQTPCISVPEEVADQILDQL